MIMSQQQRGRTRQIDRGQQKLWLRRGLLSLAATAAVAGVVDTATAQVSWMGPAGTPSSFETPTNWSGGTVPGGSDIPYIDNGGVASLSTYSGAVTALYLGSDLGLNGSLVQNGGTFNATAGLLLGQGSAVGSAGTGTYTMNSGSLGAGDIFVGSKGTGVFNLNGGTVTSASHMRLADDEGGTGILNQTGGVLNLPGFLLVGHFSPAGSSNVSTGTYNMSGGTATIQNLNVGQHPQARGTVNQSGGYITVKSNLVVAEISRQPNLYNMTGGELHIINGTTWYAGSSAGIGEIKVSGTANAQVDAHMFVGNGSTSIGTVGISGGTVALGVNKPGGGFLVGGEFGQATLRVSGGNFSMDFAQLGRRFNTTSQGQMTQSGGTVTVRRAMNIGGLSGNDNFYNISAGSLNLTNALGGGTDNFGETQPGIHVARFSADPGTGTVTTSYSKGQLLVSGTANVNVNGALYNSTGWTRAGNATLGTSTVDVPGGAGTVSVSGGNLVATNMVNGGQANAGSYNNGGASANYLQSGGVASVGAVTGTGNVAVSGGVMNVNSIAQQSLTVSGGQINVAPNGTAGATSNVKSLTMSGTGKMDLANNALVVDYTGASPAASVRAALTTGYAGGAWNGPGLNSSTANASAATTTKTALGYADASSLGAVPAIFGTTDSDAVLVRHTLYGDGDLSGTVDLTDFTFLAANFNGSGKNWLQGDYNYDGTVNLTDFTFLASNFNKTVAAEPTGLGAAVPEPVSLSVVGLLAGGAMRRRGRRQRA